MLEQAKKTEIETIGAYEKEHKNNNGNRLLNFCTENDLVIINTFCKHKDYINIHGKYNLESKNR